MAHNQHNKNQKRKKNKSNLIQDGVPGASNSLLKLPRRVGLIMPDRMFTRLRFYGLGAQTLTAATNASLRYRPTSAFDTDPNLGSAAVPGFTELAAFYSAYRVTTSKATIRFVNPSATVGIQVVLLPLNQDPGASPPSSTTDFWPANPYAIKKLLGCGGSRAETLSCTMSTEKIFGSKMVYFDDAFSSAVTTNPTNNWYWAIGIIAPVATTVTITLEISIDMGVEFFNRKVLVA